MMGNWKTCTIGDLGTVVGGATPSTKKSENYDGGTISWITPKDLAGFSGRFISRGERNITEQGLRSCSTRLMPAHTVLFSSRAPIGYIAIARQEVCTNQGFKSVIPNEDTDYMFLYYLLKYSKDKIENLGSGTTFKEVSGSTMRGIKVFVPKTIEEQCQIASVLSALDDKIEKNMEINENLEQQAVVVFRSWFSSFSLSSDIPRKGSEFGEIPEDFSIVRIGDLPMLVTDYVANGSFASLKANVNLYQEPNYAYFVRNTDLKSGSFGVFVDQHSYEFLSKSTLYGGEIIISNVGDVGSVFLCPKLDGRMTLGNNIIMLRPEDDRLRYYLYVWFKYLQGQALIQGIKGGSAQPKFNKTDFKNTSVLIPPTDMLTRFHETVAPMFETISQKQAETACLADLRDTLLPQLMSGEIDVSSLDL